MTEMIAQNLRLIRKMKGLSQSNLGQLIGVTGQMVQKYESGQSEISSSMLRELAKALNTDIRQFFDAGPSYACLFEGNQPYQVDLDDKSKELLRVFALLNLDDKDRLIAMAEALLSIKKE